MNYEDIEHWRGKLKGVHLKRFNERVKKIEARLRKPPAPPVKDPFLGIFHNAGRITLRELRADHAASGLTFDEWLNRRREVRKADEARLDELRRQYGHGGFLTKRDGTIVPRRRNTP